MDSIHAISILIELRGRSPTAVLAILLLLLKPHHTKTRHEVVESTTSKLIERPSTLVVLCIPAIRVEIVHICKQDLTPTMSKR
jgi:hypothetical protein